ncbi:hypothetical protein CAEBREN_06681 [Caenorhabditis brenneri]|uniref:C2H2-type domain-containing protein n=1 Tax=Caenorhabditis brenneri TaxID=135651 RepID=G0MD18_CAEBE|nr:hypothetical protein CAEBREN_06681 [Caenorhabditis brenneri]
MTGRASFNHNGGSGGLPDDQDLLSEFDGPVHPEMQDEIAYQPHHVTGHQCHVCHKFFTNFKGLQQHLIIHTDERPFKCEVCGQTFRFKSNLFEHASVHTGSTPYSCPYCQKMCRLKGNLKKHLRTHVTTKEELEAAWRPFAKIDPARRKSAPYQTSSARMASLREPFSDLQDDNGLSYATSSSTTTFGVPRLRKKNAGLGTAADWIKKIKCGELLPQVDLEEKIRRFEHYILSEHQNAGQEELLETAKSIAFETHHCPVCNLIFMNKDDCDSHCRVEHANMRSVTDYFCEKCFRSFADKASHAQHEKYHLRVAALFQEGELSSTEPEIVLPDPEQLQNIIEEAMSAMMLQGQAPVPVDDGMFQAAEVYY